MAIIQVQPNQGFFSAAGQSFQQGADRAQEILMQERELELAKGQANVQQQQFEQTIQQQELDRALRQEQIDIESAASAARNQLIAAQTAAQEAENAAAPNFFEIRNRASAAAASLDEARAAAIPQEIGIAEGNLALEGQRLQIAMRGQAIEAAQREQSDILQIAAALGADARAVSMLVTGSPLLDNNTLIQRNLDILSGTEAESSEALVAETLERKTNQVIGSLGFSDELETEFREDVDAGVTGDQMMADVIANEEFDSATKAKLLLGIQLIFPGTEIPNSPEKPGFLQQIQAFLTIPNIEAGLRGQS